MALCDTALRFVGRKFTSFMFGRTGNGFGLKLVGGQQRPDGRLGSFVEHLYSGETLTYLHGEISEGTLSPCLKSINSSLL